MTTKNKCPNSGTGIGQPDYNEPDTDMELDFLEALENYVSEDSDEPSSLWSEGANFGAELHRIARKCIENNWSRTDHSEGGWHYFTQAELVEINTTTGNRFDSGYCFLDEDGGTEGMIRLWQGQMNPKWSFWLKGERLMIDLA